MTSAQGDIFVCLLHRMAARLQLVKNARFGNVFLDFFRVINPYLSMWGTWAAGTQRKNRQQQRLQQYDIVRMF